MSERCNWIYISERFLWGLHGEILTRWMQALRWEKKSRSRGLLRMEDQRETFREQN